MTGARPAIFRLLLALAVLQIVVLNIYPGAPIWRWDDEAKPTSEANQLVRLDREFTTTSGGGNLGLRLRGFDINDPIQANLMCVAYYRAVYATYPRQVFVSDSLRIINTENQLIGAALPDDRWLAEHGARGVCTVEHQNGELQTQTRMISPD